MSVLLRVALIVASLFTFLYVGRKIRKSQMRLEDAIIWVLISVGLIVLSIFPHIAYWASSLFGFQAPVNFIFLVMIFILLLKLFLVSIHVSVLESKITELVQEIALRDKEL